MKLCAATTKEITADAQQQAIAQSSPARNAPAPGRWTYLASVGLFVLALEASSRSSWSGVLFAGSLATLAFLAWIIWLALTLLQRGVRLPPRDWARWLAFPAVLGVAFLVSWSPLPFEVRLGLSRPGMDAAASTLEAGGDATFGWIGWFPVERTDRLEGGFRFLISGSGFLDPIGFAYMRDGEPPVIGEDRYEPIGDGWWLWVESW
jgi:hypothetical protein